MRPLPLLSVTLCVQLYILNTHAALWNFCKQVKCATRRSSCMDFNNYGCHCGWGNHDVSPVDAIDGCCQRHDLCYRETREKHGCWRTKTDNYSWQCFAGWPACNHERNDRCERRLCECDRVASMCFAKAEYPTEKPECPINSTFFWNQWMAEDTDVGASNGRSKTTTPLAHLLAVILLTGVVFR